MPAAPASTSRTKTSRAHAPSLDDDVRANLDSALDDLMVGATVWSHLTLSQRVAVLDSLHTTVSAVAEEWATTAAGSKQLEPGHPLSGEEWLSGPYATIVSLAAYRETLQRLVTGKNPLAGIATEAAPGDRLRAQVFPTTAADGMLLSGYTGELWFTPGTTDAEIRRSAGLGQLQPAVSGGVGLVLGAGNVTSIPVLDVLYELLAHNRVVILKVNPTQDALVPVYERALAPLIEPGFLRIVRGGGEVGAFLTQDERVAHVHITGAAPTFDAIVWGPSHGTPAVKAATTRRRRENRPLLTKPITAELGGVSPIIVVPGAWSEADLTYHAEHIATMRLQNSGHNCIAGQVVIMSQDWAQRDDFLDALERAFRDAPARPVWYPRSDEKLASAAADFPAAAWCADNTRVLVVTDDADEQRALETTEYFAPVLGVVELPGNGQEFFDAAVRHSNEKLTGTLGANVLIDPITQAALGDAFESAIADLRYGTIAINTWTAFGFLTPTLSWGGFPGATLDDVESGIGIVHNAFLLDHIERSVVRGPFRPFPRSFDPRSLVASRGRSFSVLPKPPWFVTSRTAAAVSEGFTRFRIDGSVAGLSATLVQALRA